MLLHILWYRMMRAWTRFCRMSRLTYTQDIGTTARDRSVQDILIQSFWIGRMPQISTLLYVHLCRSSQKNNCYCNAIKSNVNWSVLGLIGEERCKQEFPDMINNGSCGLRNLHEAFKSGMEASEWNLVKVLGLRNFFLILLHGEMHPDLRKGKIFHCGVFVHNGMIYFP